MPKGMCPAEATSNNEKIKPDALLKVSVSQLVSQSIYSITSTRKNLEFSARVGTIAHR